MSDDIGTRPLHPILQRAACLSLYDETQARQSRLLPCSRANAIATLWYWCLRPTISFATRLISEMHVEMRPKLLRKATLSLSAFIRPIPQLTRVTSARDDPLTAVVSGKWRHSSKNLMQIPLRNMLRITIFGTAATSFFMLQPCGRKLNTLSR